MKLKKITNMIIQKFKGRFQIITDDGEILEIKKCCSNCLYYQRTYKMCKCDQSNIVGNTYTETTCKYFNLRYFKQ